MNVEEKERLIKKDIKSIENRVRSAFNQGYDMGVKELKAYKEQSGDAISRQAAIDAIRGEIEINGYSHVVDVLEQLPSAQPEQKWIPCSERLPEQYGNYLVSYRTDDFESDIGTFDPDRINSDTGEWSACDANGFYWVASKGLEVIAWMPLPEPYKGGEQDG